MLNQVRRAIILCICFVLWNNLGAHFNKEHSRKLVWIWNPITSISLLTSVCSDVGSGSTWGLNSTLVLCFPQNAFNILQGQFLLSFVPRAVWSHRTKRTIFFFSGTILGGSDALLCAHKYPTAICGLNFHLSINHPSSWTFLCRYSASLVLPEVAKECLSVRTLPPPPHIC